MAAPFWRDDMIEGPARLAEWAGCGAPWWRFWAWFKIRLGWPRNEDPQ